MPKMTPEEVSQDGRRLVELENGIIFDPKLFAALEPKSDGRFALHLAGGQILRIDVAAAIAILKQLGLTVTAARLAKQHLKPKAPRVKRAKPKPQGLWQEFVGLFS